jgi:hypothetical protein
VRIFVLSFYKKKASRQEGTTLYDKKRLLYLFFL